MPRNALVRSATLVFAFALGLVAAPAGAETVTLAAADGSKVVGDVWRAPGAKPPAIVAFHQA